MRSIYARINTAILIFIAVTGVVIVTMLATRAYGGPLDPPGPPSPTQPNLIYQPATCAGFPIVISARGSYRLASNITGCAGKDGIQITSGNVALDLAGFSVIGVPTSLAGIKNVGVGNGQLRIANGSVITWAGTAGIDLTDSTTARIDNIIAAYNAESGIVIGSTSAVNHTTSSANGAGIIVASGATNSTISDCNIDYNVGSVTQAGYGILGGDGMTVRNCSIGSNTFNGINVGAFATISNNHIHHNGGGALVKHSCMIESNSFEWNDGNGFYVSPPGNCTIVGNKATANSANGFDIEATGGYSWIDDNHASGNIYFGFVIGQANPGYPNVVTRNAASTNGAGDYSIGANNDAAPIVTAGAATNPMSNISN